jgi:hypothetical protein
LRTSFATIANSLRYSFGVIPVSRPNSALKGAFELNPTREAMSSIEESEALERSGFASSSRFSGAAARALR